MSLKLKCGNWRNKIKRCKNISTSLKWKFPVTRVLALNIRLNKANATGINKLPNNISEQLSFGDRMVTNSCTKATCGMLKMSLT